MRLSIPVLITLVAWASTTDAGPRAHAAEAQKPEPADTDTAPRHPSAKFDASYDTNSGATRGILACPKGKKAISIKNGIVALPFSATNPAWFEHRRCKDEGPPCDQLPALIGDATLDFGTVKVTVDGHGVIGQDVTLPALLTDKMIEGIRSDDYRKLALGLKTIHVTGGLITTDDLKPGGLGKGTSGTLKIKLVSDDRDVADQECSLEVFSVGFKLAPISHKCLPGNTLLHADEAKKCCHGFKVDEANIEFGRCS